MTHIYKLVFFAKDGTEHILGRGNRQQVKWNRDYLRKKGLPGRYEMTRDKKSESLLAKYEDIILCADILEEVK